MDSDNYAPKEYFDEWINYMQKNGPFTDRDCFLPGRLLTTKFDFRDFSYYPIDRHNYKQAYAQRDGDALFNTGNFIIPRLLHRNACGPKNDFED
jgi:hypothetical protein